MCIYLEIEIAKMIHSEIRESIKQYLEKNGLYKLTRVERIEVMNYEKEMNKKMIWKIYSQIQNDGILTQKGASHEWERDFMNILTKNLHPDLYMTLGWKTTKWDMLQKAA